MMPRVRKLRRYVTIRGESVATAASRSCSERTGPGSGTRISRTMSVITMAKTPSLSAAMRSSARPATWLYDVITAVLPLRAHSSQPRQLGDDTSRLDPLRGHGGDLGDPVLPDQARGRGAHAGDARVP